MLYLLSARCDCDDVCQCVFKSFLTCCGCWLLVLGVFAVCVLEAYKPRYIAKTHSHKPISPLSSNPRQTLLLVSTGEIPVQELTAVTFVCI